MNEQDGELPQQPVSSDGWPLLPGSAYPPSSQSPGPATPPSYPPQTLAPTPAEQRPVTQPPYPYAAPNSQPFYPAGMPSPFSQPLQSPNQPLYPMVSPQRVAKRSRTALWISLVVAGVLLLAAGGGAAFVVFQMSAPASAAAQFCTDLKTQDYGGAYGMLSSTLHADYTQTEFGQLVTSLDQVEGKVTACAQASGGKSYRYNFGATSASVILMITREKQGVLQGDMRLVKGSGGWRVNSLDTALLGINPGALEVAQTFCSAMQSQNYSLAYNTLALTAQDDMTASGFAANAQLDDKFDGTVSACNITAIGQGNNDSSATVTVSVARSRAGTTSGTLTLSGSGGTWQIAAIDPGVRGIDYGAIAAGELFCETVALPTGGTTSADLAYDLLAPDLRQSVSKQTFESDWGRPGIQYVCGDPDLSTFQLSGDQASYSTSLTLSDYFGDSRTFRLTLDFERNNGVWQVDGYSWK